MKTRTRSEKSQQCRILIQPPHKLERCEWAAIFAVVLEKIHLAVILATLIPSMITVPTVDNWMPIEGTALILSPAIDDFVRAHSSVRP